MGGELDVDDTDMLTYLIKSHTQPQTDITLYHEVYCWLLSKPRSHLIYFCCSPFETKFNDTGVKCTCFL